jgi:hypothetical protein
MSMGLVTISSIVVAHRALNIDIPFPLILALTVLDIVVPRYRAFAAGTLGILYGLIILPLGIIYVIFARKDPAEYLIANLEKIIAIIRNTSDQHSRQKVP